MRSILAFENITDYSKYQAITERMIKRLKKYQAVLEEKYLLVSVPKAIVWTNENLATTVFSNNPIPAYTNENLIFISPDLEEWSQLFLRIIDSKDIPTVRKFFENFSEDLLFDILAHELTHHSDLFLDEFDDEREDSIWFEEGMCTYLPRKLAFSPHDFEKFSLIESELVEVFKSEYGNRTLDEFGNNSYSENLSSIMFDYWRSFLTVKQIVERENNDIRKVFDDYHQWHKSGRKQPLSQFFSLDTNKL